MAEVQEGAGRAHGTVRPRRHDIHAARSTRDTLVRRERGELLGGHDDRLTRRDARVDLLPALAHRRSTSYEKTPPALDFDCQGERRLIAFAVPPDFTAHVSGLISSTGPVASPLGGRDLDRGGPMLTKPAITGASVRHYSALRAFPPDASGAMFRGLSDAGFQLPRLSGGPTGPAYSSPSTARYVIGEQVYVALRVSVNQRDAVRTPKRSSMRALTTVVARSATCRRAPRPAHRVRSTGRHLGLRTRDTPTCAPDRYATR